jgi:hypothetical protein
MVSSTLSRPRIKSPFVLGRTNGQGPVSFQQSETIYPTSHHHFSLPVTISEERINTAQSFEAGGREIASPLLLSESSISNFPTRLTPQLALSENEIISPLTLETPILSKVGFLDLPLEIRKEIYIYILLAHPISHPDLAKLPDPKSDSLTNELLPHEKINQAFKPLGVSYPSMGREKEMRMVLGKMPTALLLGNRQIYYEVRGLPFELNTWNFAAYYGSSLGTAARWARKLRAWQRRDIRWMAIKVLPKDLLGVEEICGSLGVGEWISFREEWSNVRILRVEIASTFVDEEVEVDERVRHPILNVGAEWIQGLELMKNLRYLELGVEEGLAVEVKREFCGNLEEVLNKDRLEGGRIEVGLVER